MNNKPARPIDLHCQGLLPWADPYIAQLVHRAQRENPEDQRFNSQISYRIARHEVVPPNKKRAAHGAAL